MQINLVNQAKNSSGVSNGKKVVKINESDIDEIFEEMERREDIDVDA